MNGKPETDPCQNDQCIMFDKNAVMGINCMDGLNFPCRLHSADLANPSEVYDRIQGYIRVIQEKDALIADLAKPSEWISGPCPTCQTDPEGNSAMVSGWLEINRTHEECADCRFLYSANPPCKGHFPGPVCCPRFKPPTRETP